MFLIDRAFIVNDDFSMSPCNPEIAEKAKENVRDFPGLRIGTHYTKVGKFMVMIELINDDAPEPKKKNLGKGARAKNHKAKMPSENVLVTV